MTLLNSQYLFINNCRALIRQIFTVKFPAEQDLTEASRTARRKKKEKRLKSSGSLLFKPNFHHKGSSISVHRSLMKLEEDHWHYRKVEEYTYIFTWKWWMALDCSDIFLRIKVKYFFLPLTGKQGLKEGMKQLYQCWEAMLSDPRWSGKL